MMLNKQHKHQHNCDKDRTGQDRLVAAAVLFIQYVAFFNGGMGKCDDDAVAVDINADDDDELR